ncbi:hypothetical protein G9464_01380 [Halostella sp. JP-L12]|uniref:hypothetical protein n=1 Tax=Halostella TaxID=1843185 RepID=UPI000EF83820|nr:MULTISPECIES: hypothetical protein [Halostella]NHN46252.1 hypothetical protein [Halostella sp. JP-L12]
MSREEPPTPSESVQDPVNRENQASFVDKLRLPEGTITGGGAFVLAYLFYRQIVTFSMTVSGPMEEGPAAWIVSGWYFFASHGVGLEASGEAVGLGTLPVNTLSSSFSFGGWLLQVLILFLPVILLVGAGYLVTSWTDPDDLTELVAASVSVALPYLVLSLVAAVLMSHSFTDEQMITSIIQSSEPLADKFDEVPGNLEVGVSLADAALYAGVFYPVVFGLVGGAIAKKNLLFDELADALN